jgi:hypothetical protein
MTEIQNSKQMTIFYTSDLLSNFQLADIAQRCDPIRVKVLVIEIWLLRFVWNLVLVICNFCNLN